MAFYAIRYGRTGHQLQQHTGPIGNSPKHELSTKLLYPEAGPARGDGSLSQRLGQSGSELGSECPTCAQRMQHADRHVTGRRSLPPKSPVDQRSSRTLGLLGRARLHHCALSQRTHQRTHLPPSGRAGAQGVSVLNLISRRTQPFNSKSPLRLCALRRQNAQAKAKPSESKA